MHASNYLLNILLLWFDSASRLLFFLQDLEYLCEGLEGRSSNPVAVLFDSLLLPDSDFGLEHTSPLEWRYEPERAVPHLVLGKGPPGGAWHVRTSNCWFPTFIYFFFQLAKMITDDKLFHVKGSKHSTCDPHEPKCLKFLLMSAPCRPWRAPCWRWAWPTGWSFLDSNSRTGWGKNEGS